MCRLDLLRADAADLCDPLARRARLENLVNLAFEGSDTIVNLKHESVKTAADLPHPPRQFVVSRR